MSATDTTPATTAAWHLKGTGYEFCNCQPGQCPMFHRRRSTGRRDTSSRSLASENSAVAFSAAILRFGYPRALCSQIRILHWRL